MHAVQPCLIQRWLALQSPEYYRLDKLICRVYDQECTVHMAFQNSPVLPEEMVDGPNGFRISSSLGPRGLKVRQHNAKDRKSAQEICFRQLESSNSDTCKAERAAHVAVLIICLRSFSKLFMLATADRQQRRAPHEASFTCSAFLSASCKVQMTGSM